jgi:hypothetical protein
VLRYPATQSPGSTSHRASTRSRDRPTISRPAPTQLLSPPTRMLPRPASFTPPSTPCSPRRRALPAPRASACHGKAPAHSAPPLPRTPAAVLDQHRVALAPATPGPLLLPPPAHSTTDAASTPQRLVATRSPAPAHPSATQLPLPTSLLRITTSRNPKHLEPPRSPRPARPAHCPHLGGIILETLVQAHPTLRLCARHGTDSRSRNIYGAGILSYYHLARHSHAYRGAPTCTISISLT